MCTLSGFFADDDFTLQGLVAIDYPDESLVIAVKLYQVGGNEHTRHSLHIVGEHLTNHTGKQFAVVVQHRSLYFIGTRTRVGTHATLCHMTGELAIAQCRHHNLHRRTLGNALDVILRHSYLHLHTADVHQLCNGHSWGSILAYLGKLRRNIARRRCIQLGIAQRLSGHGFLRFGTLQLVLNGYPLHLGQRTGIVQFLHAVVSVLRLLQRSLADGIGVLQRRGVQLCYQLSLTHRLTFTHIDTLDSTRSGKRQRNTVCLLNGT